MLHIKLSRIKSPVLVISLLAATMPALFASPAYAKADNVQDTKILDALVAGWLGSEIGAPGGARSPVDQRLKLAQCPETPTISNGQMNEVIVRCAPLNWRISVPINISNRNSLTPGTAVARPERPAHSASTRYTPANNEIAIRRGEPVRLTIRKRGFSLSRMMIADSNGRIGDVIAVRADRRERPIMVRITDMGEASLMM
jgi:flagella basal body P-ring formation protein FlgA